MKRYDVAVIGAGIHGAGVAQAAAAAGYTTLLLEQYAQPAQGTSSRSSKLIHGGLRYLEGGHFRLVRESLQEQALLLKNAPQLVRSVPFYFPVYGRNRRPAWMVRAGLMLYRLLGGAPFRTVPEHEWDQLDGLQTDGLQHLFEYRDAQTDDAQLTRAVLESAQGLGAEARFSAELVQGIRLQAGYRIRFEQQGQMHEVESSVLINAAGPWVNRVLERVTPQPSVYPVELVAGTHIVLPRPLARGVYYIEAADGRAVFAMPWQGASLVGTTETLFEGDPASVEPQPEEIDYLLAVYNTAFSTAFTVADVAGSFAGLRVLPAASASPFHRSRETIFHADNAAAPRLFTIYGGKLTGYRATAGKLLNRIRPLLPHRQRKADTRTLPLTPAGKLGQ